MADLAVAAIPSELNYEPVTSIPPGYQTVQYKVPSYNNIPAPTHAGTEIQINIPHTENAFLDPTTTYLDVLCEVEATINLPGNSTGEPGDFSSLAVLNYLRGPGWTLFRRYQVYANSAINIEDVDEVGILASMMNNLSRSNVTWASGAAMGDDETNVCPGMKFGFVITQAIPYYGLLPALGVMPVYSTLAVGEENAVTVNNIGIDGPNTPVSAQIRINRRHSSAQRYSRLDFARGRNVLGYLFNKKELMSFTEVMQITDAAAIDGGQYQFQESIGPGGIWWLTPAVDFNIASNAVNSYAAAYQANWTVRVKYPMRRAQGQWHYHVFHTLPGAVNRAVDVNETPSILYYSEHEALLVPHRARLHNRRVKYTFRMSLPLFGLLGSNNDKLYPLFCGPTQLRLTTEDPAKFIKWSPVLIDPSFKIRELNFCANQLVLSGDAIRAVIGRLPVRDLIPIRCTTFTHSSEVIPAQSQGLHQLLVASRRASMKALFISYERSLNQDVITEGKFASIHPNISQGTHLFLNNTMYPRHGIDMTNNAADAYQQLLICLNQTQSAIMRPNVLFSEFCTSDMDYNETDVLSAATIMWNGRDEALTIVEAATNAATVGIAVNKYMGNIVRGIAEHPISMLQTLPRAFNVPRNKSYTVIDTEHFGRRNFLSGVSTLTGNTFFNLQIGTPVTSGYVVHFFNYHDIILAFDLNTRNVTIKL